MSVSVILEKSEQTAITVKPPIAETAEKKRASCLIIYTGGKQGNPSSQKHAATFGSSFNKNSSLNEFCLILPFVSIVSSS